MIPDFPTDNTEKTDIEEMLPAIQISGGHKAYKDGTGTKIVVLDNLSMTVDHGSMYSLVGESGCGKTTLLSCIVGLDNFDYGKLTIFGQDCGMSSRIAPQLIGFMPQEISLNPVFKPLEMLYYYGLIAGMKKAEIEANSLELLDLFGLRENESQLINELSGGQSRRLSLAVALLHKPSLLVLDEPTVGLDPVLRHEIWTHLRKLVSTRATSIIMTTHFLEETKFCDKMAIMRRGKMIFEGFPDSLLSTFGENTVQASVYHLYRQDNANPLELLDQRKKPEMLDMNESLFGKTATAAPDLSSYFLQASQIL